MVNRSDNSKDAPDQDGDSEHWSRRSIFAGVLVGGTSSRMGTPKSLLRLQETTFVEHVIAVMGQRAEHTVLLGSGPTPQVSPDIDRLEDVPGLAGPIAGIMAALLHRPDVCWLIAACDMPYVRVEAVDWLLAERRSDRWAVLPVITPQRLERLLAVYEPQSRVLLERIAARGQRSLRSLAKEPRVHSPTPPRSLHDCWTNVNTPDELRRLECDTD